MAPLPPLLHATAVAIGGQGVLLLGRSGAGKSDLALRLVDRGAELVADDQVALTVRDNRLWLAPPAGLAGLIELRGLGAFPVGHCPSAPALAGFDLDNDPARLPAIRHRRFGAVSLPLFPLRGLEASAPLRVERAVAMLQAEGLKGFDMDGRFGRSQAPE